MSRPLNGVTSTLVTMAKSSPRPKPMLRREPVRSSSAAMYVR